MNGHHDWKAIRSLLPYLYEFKGRIALALTLLILAKFANVGIPLALKDVIDALVPSQQDIIFLPIAMFIAYGMLRLASSLFSELRDALFAKVIFNSVSRIAGNIFQHLDNLSLRFQLQRQTGGISRVIERSSKLSGREKQCVAIAHRLSTVIDADNIIVLNQGRIIEQGSHQQLLAQKENYATMCALQQTEGTKNHE